MPDGTKVPRNPDFLATFLPTKALASVGVAFRVGRDGSCEPSLFSDTKHFLSPLTHGLCHHPLVVLHDKKCGDNEKDNEQDNHHPWHDPE